jgi:hypothetical protein
MLSAVQGTQAVPAPVKPWLHTHGATLTCCVRVWSEFEGHAVQSSLPDTALYVPVSHSRHTHTLSLPLSLCLSLSLKFYC